MGVAPAKPMSPSVKQWNALQSVFVEVIVSVVRGRGRVKDIFGNHCSRSRAQSSVEPTLSTEKVEIT